MKVSHIALAAALLATPVIAADATTGTSTNVTTGVSTTQDSGLTIGDKAHIKGDVYTGSNTADTSVDTSVRNRASTSQSNDTTHANRSYNSDNGRGHKYGHDKR